MYHILMLGPQGSGKGTQAELLSKKLGIPMISVGQLWRKEIEEGTEWGKAYGELYRQGRLAPDEQTNELVHRRVNAPDAKDGFILDGYPRNQKQLEALEQFAPATHVIVLELSDNEALTRLGGRRVCSVCGKNYHILYNPTAREGICDDDGAPLIIRNDDRPEAIRERLRIYHSETEPLLEYYNKKGVVYKIDAAGAIEQIAAEISKIFS